MKKSISTLIFELATSTPRATERHLFALSITTMGNTISGFLHDQEIRIWGNEWLARVADTNNNNGETKVHWKPLDEWVAVYEPPRHESERERRIKESLERKAQQVLLETIDRRIVARILRLLLDVASQLLSQAESLFASPESTIAQIFNNINGIVLTFRFHCDEQDYKMQFLRRTATDNLTQVLWDECLPNEDTAATLMQIQTRLKNALLQLENEVVPAALVKLDEMFLHVDKEIDKRVEERFGDSQVSLAFEERLLQLDTAANQVTTKIEQVTTVAQEVAMAADEAVDLVVGKDGATAMVRTTVSETANAAAQQAEAIQEATVIRKQEVETTVHDEAVKLEHEVIAAKNDALLKKTQVAANFAQLVKSLILSKVEDLTTQIMNIIDKILLAFYEMHRLAQVAETKSTHSLEQVQTEMYNRVELLAAHVTKAVDTEVRSVSGTICSIIHQPEIDQNEKAQELEGKGGTSVDNN